MYRWICRFCGDKYGFYRVGTSTWHEGECAWCHEDGVPVTNSRDYSYPQLPGELRDGAANNRGHPRSPNPDTE